MIQYIVDVPDQLKSLVYSRFWKPRILAYIKALGGVFQTIESDTYGTTFSILIDQATGETLNRWGTLVDEQRLGLSDESFRRVIRSKIAASRASGVAPKILDTLTAYTGDPDTEFRTSASGWVRVAYTGLLSDAEHVRLLRILRLAIPAGFGLEVIEMAVDPFRFGDSFGRAFNSQRIDS
jgi:hypothetical protein